MVNQAEQILNYSDNNHDGITPLIVLYTNCEMVMNKYIKQNKNIGENEYNDFKNSLELSRKCMAGEKEYRDVVDSLLDLNKRSFIILPIIMEDHVFSATIYKNKENYEFVLINEGGGFYSQDREDDEHYSFEKYTISKDNIKDVLQYIKKVRKV